jgi:hypothetical protein
MSPLILRFGIVPGLALLPLTLLRVWLELRHPDSPAVKFASVTVAANLFILFAAILLLRRGISFPRFLAAMATFTLVARLPIAIAYAMAWSQQWTTPDGAPVRYVQDLLTLKVEPGTSAALVFAANLGIGFVFNMVFATLVWFIAWAIAFRGKRPPCSAPATA